MLSAGSMPGVIGLIVGRRLAIDPVTNTPVVSRAQGARACLHSIA